MKNWFTTKRLMLIAVLPMVLAASTCDTDATVASRNLSKAAEQFEITRRILFVNGITGDVLHVIEGRCSIEVQMNQRQLEVTCKRDAEGNFTKDFLGLSDNTFYVVTQMVGIPVSVYHYRSIVKPQSIIPDFDVKINTGELLEVSTAPLNSVPVE